jgi:hypothetical protein
MIDLVLISGVLLFSLSLCLFAFGRLASTVVINMYEYLISMTFCCIYTVPCRNCYSIILTQVSRNVEGLLQ